MSNQQQVTKKILSTSEQKLLSNSGPEQKVPQSTVPQSTVPQISEQKIIENTVKLPSAENIVSDVIENIDESIVELSFFQKMKNKIASYFNNNYILMFFTIIAVLVVLYIIYRYIQKLKLDTFKYITENQKKIESNNLDIDKITEKVENIAMTQHHIIDEIKEIAPQKSEIIEDPEKIEPEEHVEKFIENDQKTPIKKSESKKKKKVLIEQTDDIDINLCDNDTCFIKKNDEVL